MVDGVYKMWWCGGVAGDYILYAEAGNPSGPWHARGSGAANSSNVVFGPRNGTGAFDNLHTCDPSIVRANGAYYMYYGALKAGANEPTTMGLASSVGGLNWTRLNGGNPIVVPVRSILSVPNAYGAGQPSVTFVDGKFYLIYTDTTGYAADGNGGGQFVLRSSDPAFQTGVEELTANGFAPRTAENHTRYSLISAFSVDWQYVDHLQAFLIAQHTSSGVTIFRTFDKSLRTEISPAFTVPQNWREGPGLVSRPDKHAVPSASCGVVPIDYLHAVGGDDPNTWDLARRGFDLLTGRSCQDSNLPATMEGYQMLVWGLPLTTVFGGLRLQWALADPVNWISRNGLGVSSEFFHSVPYGGSVFPGQQVLGATARPAAFNIEGRLWPVDCLEVITANQSQIHDPLIWHYPGYGCLPTSLRQPYPGSG